MNIQELRKSFAGAFGLFSLYLLYMCYETVAYNTYAQEKWQGYLLSIPYLSWVMLLIFVLLAILVWPKRGNYKR